MLEAAGSGGGSQPGDGWVLHPVGAVTSVSIYHVTVGLERCKVKGEVRKRRAGLHTHFLFF